MKTNPSPAERRHAAQTALQALSAQRDEHLLCSVRCSRNHHVAAVYDTAAGPVYEALTGPHAHGRRDFIDAGHHGQHHGTPILDLLDAGTDPTVDDALPAWCECGPRILSRSELQDALAAHQRQLLVS